MTRSKRGNETNASLSPAKTSHTSQLQHATPAFAADISRIADSDTSTFITSILFPYSSARRTPRFDKPQPLCRALRGKCVVVVVLDEEDDDISSLMIPFSNAANSGHVS